MEEVEGVVEEEGHGPNGADLEKGVAEVGCAEGEEERTGEEECEASGLGIGNSDKRCDPLSRSIRAVGRKCWTLVDWKKTRKPGETKPGGRT